MASKDFVNAIISVKKRAKEGFKLSELSGVEKRAAERLIDQGKLMAYPSKGDFIVTEK